MADVKISALEQATSLDGLIVMGTILGTTNRSVYVPIAMLKGNKGDAFTYSDFTAEQLAALKGNKGDAFTYSDFTAAQLAALKGAKGDAFTYSDFTAEQLAALKGNKGDAFTYSDFTSAQLAALKGDKGDAFTYSDFTAAQLAALKGAKGDAFTYSDFTAAQLAALKGAKGDAFTYSDFTAAQLAALKGAKGGKSSFVNEYVNGELEYIAPNGVITEEIYSKIITINLPTIVDTTVNAIISDERIGNNIYLVLDNINVSSGFDNATNLLNDFYEFKIVNIDNISYVRATCKTAPSALTLYAYVKVSYIKYYGQKITFDVACDSAASAANLELTIPVLKFNKTLLASLTGDDANVSHFCVCHNLINNRPTSYEGSYWCLHKNQQDVGDLPSTITEALGHTLCSTDGCGNDRRFAMTCAIWPNAKNANDPTTCLMDGTQAINPTADNQYRFANPNLEWLDLEEMLEFGDSIAQHDVGIPDAGSATVNEIIAGFNEDVAKTITKLGRGMKMLVRPSSYMIYETAFALYPLYLLNVAANHNAVLPFSADLNLWKLSALREVYETPTDMESVVTTEMSKTTENRKWCHSGIHRATQGAVDLLTWYYQNYGKAGNDSIWFASMDEYYEYWFMRKYAVISKVVEGSNAHFEILIPKGQYFYYPELTFVSNNPFVSLSNISDNIIGESNSNTIINVNLDTSLLSRAEKYVSKYEISQNGIDLADAQYFVDQLKDGTAKDGFNDRINAVEAPILITGLSITTKPTSITDTEQLTITYSPNDTTQRGVMYSSSNNSMAIISGDGLITVLAAGVVTFTVTSASDPTLTDSFTATCALSVILPTSIVVTGDNTGAAGDTIQLTATIQPSGASHAVTWSSSNLEKATVNSSGLVSLVAEGSVIITATSVADPTKSGTLQISIANNLPDTWKSVISLSSHAWVQEGLVKRQANGDGQMINVALSTWAVSPSGSKINTDIVDTNGNVIGTMIYDATHYPTATETDLSALAPQGGSGGPTLTDASMQLGPYLAEFYRYFCTPIPNASGKKGCIDFSVPTGTYIIRIYVSTAAATNAAQNKQYCKYKINSETEQALTFETTNNATQYIEFPNVVVADGNLDIRVYADGKTLYGYPGMNLIEINKIG